MEYNLSDQIIEGGMDGAHGIYGGEISIKAFGGET